MAQREKKVIALEKKPWTYYNFFRTFLIGLTAFIFMSSFYKNDVAPLEKVLDDPKVFSIYFAFNSANIIAEHAVILREVVKMLKEDKTLHVKIEGHADKLIDEIYNLKISKDRANNTKKYLLKYIAKNRITTEFFGSSKPDEKNIHLPWLNRRVDITVYK